MQYKCSICFSSPKSHSSLERFTGTRTLTTELQVSITHVTMSLAILQRQIEDALRDMISKSVVNASILETTLKTISAALLEVHIEEKKISAFVSNVKAQIGF